MNPGARTPPGREPDPVQLIGRADTLTALGRWDAASAALDAARQDPEIAQDTGMRIRIRRLRARISAGRRDPMSTERLLAELERESGGWPPELQVDFLCEAADLLDRLGLSAPARRCTAAARDLSAAAGMRAGAEVAAVEALMLARAGDPDTAIAALEDCGPEALPLWRRDLLGAWALLRGGDRAGAAERAADALERAGAEVAVATEPDLTEALAPLGAEAGSAIAAGLVRGEHSILVRLFGAPEFAVGDTPPRPLPGGQPGELVTLLALVPHGLPVDVVLEVFFPDAAPGAGRQRLRQVLTRLRAGGGPAITRDEEMLTLGPAWVDVRAFAGRAQRARAANGAQADLHRHAALALASRGPLSVSERIAGWSDSLPPEAAALLPWAGVGLTGPDPAGGDGRPDAQPAG